MVGSQLQWLSAWLFPAKGKMVLLTTAENTLQVETCQSFFSSAHLTVDLCLPDLLEPLVSGSY